MSVGSDNAEVSLYEELCRLLKAAAVEIRIESFKTPPESAGGLCVMKGNRLVLLHSGATKAERAQALLEVIEKIGLSSLGVTGLQLSPELLARLNRRGKMKWPHKSQAPRLAKADHDEGRVSLGPLPSSSSPSKR